MKSTMIIDIPPRIMRGALGRPGAGVPLMRGPGGGEDELRVLARQIVAHDPALALLLARAGERRRES
jgi:hypothetical protein